MAKKSPFLVWTPQFWSQDPKKPFPCVPLIGELITLKDTPPISNRFGARVPPALKKNASWPISPLYSIHIQKKSSWPKQNVSNSSQIIQWSSVGHITIHFRGSSTIQGPLEGSEAIFWPKNDRFWPPLPTRSNFFGSKCLPNVSHE